MTDMPTDIVSEILQEEKFTIVELKADPDTSDTIFTIVHDLHPEDEVMIKLISTGDDGEDAMSLQFEGPDNWTDDEAKAVLNEVMDVIIKIIEKAVEGDEDLEDPEDPEESEATPKEDI